MCQLGSFVQKPNARKPYVVGGSLHKTARNAPEPFFKQQKSIPDAAMIHMGCLQV